MITFINAADLLKDPTYKCIPTFQFTIAEAGTYIIAACMPTLRPLKRRLFPEYSFTKLVDSTLKRITTRNTNRYSSRSARKTGIIRTSNFELGFKRARLGNMDLETASTTELNDLGYLATDQYSKPLSRSGRC
jgi:hypothetical protein